MKNHHSGLRSWQGSSNRNINNRITEKRQGIFIYLFIIWTLDFYDFCSVHINLFSSSNSWRPLVLLVFFCGLPKLLWEYLCSDHLSVHAARFFDIVDTNAHRSPWFPVGTELLLRSLVSSLFFVLVSFHQFIIATSGLLLLFNSIFLFFLEKLETECKECITLSRILTLLCHPMNWYCVRTFSHLPWAGRDITLLLHIQSVTAVLVVEGDKKSPTVMPQRCYGGLTSSLFCLLITAAVLAVRDVNGSWSKSQRVRCFHH